MFKNVFTTTPSVNDVRIPRSLLSRSVGFAVSLALVVGSTDASAQQNPATSELDEVVVTGSRLVVDGTQAPTPVTVVSTEQMQLAAPRTMTEALLQLPVFAGSVSVANQSTGTTSSNGAAHLNLRGLGTSRTLVLLDGRRVVPATNIGSVDIALLPEALVQRVEVVTGGASAAYGSEAVSGVVNFVLDTKFEGMKASIQGSISEQGDNEGGKVLLAGGQSLMNDRLHAIGSLEFYTSAGVPTANARDWAFGGTGYINNPAATAATATASNPIRLLVNNPLTSIASYGGLITNTALAGTTFDVGGVPRPFQYGAFRTAATMAGSSDPTAYNPNLELTLQPEQTRTSAFFHLTYDLSDTLEIYTEGNYSQNDIYYNSLPTFELSQTAFTIFPDNAYLPASIRSQMVAGNIASFTMGRVSPDIGIPTMDATSKTTRVVLGFDGKLGEKWTYGGYYQYGRNASLFQTKFNPISERLYQAVDAVVNPATGKIVCRTTLVNPSDGCVPMNVFGRGSPSAESIAYATGTAVQDSVVRQDVVEFSIQGEAMELPAGPLGVAFGGGYRKEKFVQVVDPNSSFIRKGITGSKGFPTSLVNTLGGYERTNPQPSKGDLDVTEAFAELNLPVLSGASLAEKLTFNGAVRYSDYSTSGGITSWKLGVVYEPISSIRFRATKSADIRAPSLGELYRGSSQGTATITDPSRNNQVRNALTGNIGNTELEPEEADTTVFGVVLQPESLPSLSMSVDYYAIDIEKALSALSAQRTVDLCFQGSTSLCRFVQRDTLGQISRVELPFFNVDFRNAEGLDIEVSYKVDLAASTLGLRLVANHLLSFETQVAGSAPIELAGDIGTNSTPKWTGVLSADWKFGDWSVYLQERYVGSGKFDNTYTERDADKNFQSAYYYTDATLNYSYGQDTRYKWFVTVNNMFDKDPPLTPGILIAGANYGNRTLYDMIGRMYSAGVRIQF